MNIWVTPHCAAKCKAVEKQTTLISTYLAYCSTPQKIADCAAQHGSAQDILALCLIVLLDFFLIFHFGAFKFLWKFSFYFTHIVQKFKKKTWKKVLGKIKS